MISENPRVRFAPSPTGYLHVGGLRTALYNYLFARRNNGSFILRIEDTDRNRYVEGAVENLIKVLNWIGLTYDEGPDKPGNYGPYMQSERLDIYRKYALELVEQNKAYYCFCSAERLQALREQQQAAKEQAKYDKHCLHLSKDEIEQRIKNGEPYVIRLNVEPDQIIHISDVIRGEVEFNSSTVDDQVLLKSDGYPTYHLANVVDDHLMKITHVIRGEEWLSSTPKHVLLYDFFGWEKPVFAHLPLLLNSDRSKLSKRQGDVAVEDYKAKGFLKEALLNFVALLGWNAGDDKEFYYLSEMVEKFSLERVNKSGAIFNLDKLNWLNAEHLRNMSDQDLLTLLRQELNGSKYADQAFSDEYLIRVIHAMKERVSFIGEFISTCPYFYEDPADYDADVIKKRWNESSAALLLKLYDKFSTLDGNAAKEDYELALKTAAEENGVGNGKLIHPLRLAISGVGAGPGVFDIVDIIGRDKTLVRMKRAAEVLG
ncbi:MAG: glutamate--tRNA ligase [Bacteroidota bacterium]